MRAFILGSSIAILLIDVFLSGRGHLFSAASQLCSDVLLVVVSAWVVEIQFTEDTK